MTPSFADAGDLPVFQREVIDLNRTTTEPVVSLASGDIPWISGHAPAEVHSHVWRRVGPGEFEDVEPPALNMPPGEPNLDGVVDASGDGRIYWAAIRPLLNNEIELWASSRPPAGPWTNPVKIGDGLDRPWFFSIGNQTYLVTTDTIAQPELVKVFRAINGGSSWDPHSVIEDAGGVHDYGGGFPTALANGRVVIPLRIDGAEVGAAVSDDAAETWAVTIFVRDNVDGTWHWSAGDAGGTAYVVWREALQLAGLQDRVFMARLAPGQLLWDLAYPLTDEAGEKWGPALVGGAAGKLGLAWYEQDDGLHPWTVRFRHVTSADEGTPVLGPDVWVDAHAADPEFVNDVFADFLSVARQGDGRVVIAYNCFTDDPPPHAALCDQNEHNPVLARQVEGPVI